MKKPAALLFILLFALPFAGTYVYFFVRMNQIHYEMRSQMRALPDDRFQKIILSKEGYHHALVEEDELKLDGKMYDVARIETRGDAVIVFALHDEAEDNLLSFLHEVLKNASRDERGIPPQVIQFITLSFITPTPLATPYQRSPDVKGSTLYFRSTVSFITSLDAPPPRA